jgi:hypothetical protein
VRRFLALLTLALLAPVLSHATVLIRRPGVVASAPAVEVVASTDSRANTVSSTCTITTSANTTKVFALLAYRRNASQSILGCTFNGVAMTDSGATATLNIRTSIFYLNNPGSVTNGNISCTLSASSPGIGLSGIAFTGATVIKSTGTSAAAVTTSSATISSGLAVGDIMLDFFEKQDPTTSDPTLTTAGANLRINYTFSTVSNGGFFKSATIAATGTSQDINFSWTSSGNAAHSWLAVSP